MLLTVVELVLDNAEVRAEPFAPRVVSGAEVVPVEFPKVPDVPVGIKVELGVTVVVVPLPDPGGPGGVQN
jgi:hypothetical protein